jgi:hypothetical protein
MPKRQRIAVVVEIETDDPALSYDKINAAHESARNTEAIRRAIMHTMPGGVKRVVLVTSPDLMKALLMTHELAAEITGMDQMFSRPPDDYDPPDGRA